MVDFSFQRQDIRAALGVSKPAEWVDFQARHCWHQCLKERSETSVLAAQNSMSVGQLPQAN